MPRYLVPLLATSTAVGAAAAIAAVADVLGESDARLVPENIGAHYPPSQGYSAWRAVGLDGCEKREDVSDLAVGDLDGDGVLEVVFGSLKIQRTKGVHLMRRNPADNSWTCPVSLDVSQPVTRVAIAALQPGPPAILAASLCEGDPCLLKVKPQPGTAPELLYRREGVSGSHATDFRVADLNEDGVLDIALTFANLPNPSKPLAPVILTGRMERDDSSESNVWKYTAEVLADKITYGFALEVGVFSEDRRPGVLFGGISEECTHRAQERQPVGVLAVHRNGEWEMAELETNASGRSDEPRWVIDLAIGTTGTEVGLASAHSHCPGGDDETKPYGCTPDSRSELKLPSLAGTAVEALPLTSEHGEWRSLAYLGPSRWALGFVETERYTSGGSPKFRPTVGSALLVNDTGAEPTSQIPGGPIEFQDVAPLTLRAPSQLEQVRVPARQGTQVTAYPLHFAPSLSCDGAPFHGDALTWVPESRLVTIGKLPSPCSKPELTYFADKHPALVALDRAQDAVFISEPVN